MLELMAKDSGSGHQGCPSVYDTGEQAAVWSNRIRPSFAGEIPNHLPGEDGVEISWSVLCAAVDAYRARQGR